MMLAGKMSLYGEMSCSEIQSVYEELGLARPARRDEGTQAGQITPKPGPGEPPEQGVATLLQILCPSRKFMFDSKSCTEVSTTPDEEDMLKLEEDDKLKFEACELTKRHSMSSNETSFSFKTQSEREKNIFSPECSPSSGTVDKKCVTFARNPKSECSLKNIERRAKKIKRALSYSKSSHFESRILKRDTFEEKSTLGVGGSEEISSAGMSSTDTTCTVETRESLDETKYTSPSTQSELVSSDPSINVMDPSMNVLDNMRRLKEHHLEEDMPTRETVVSESGERDSSELDQEKRAKNPSSWRSTLDTESALTITGDLLGDLRKEMLDPGKTEVPLHPSPPLIKFKKSKKPKRNGDVVDKGSNTDCYFPFWHEPNSHKQKKERLENRLKAFEKTLTLSKKDNLCVKKGDVKSCDELYETCGESEESDLSMLQNNNQTVNNREHVETVCQNNVVSKFEWSKSPFLAYDTEGSSPLVSDTTCSNTISRESTKHAQVQCTCTCETQVDLHPFNIYSEGGTTKKMRKNKFLTTNRRIAGDSSLGSGQTLSNCCSDTLLYNKSNMKTYHEVVTFPKVGDEKRNAIGKPKIFWAITKINIYPDDSRTYEVMPLTGKKPSDVPDKSDSVFVLIPPKHKQFCGLATNTKY